jgi:NADPH-dependent 2,4-dienoyl-CoA reductase/sulfur reductase-like enzyme/peroxiredoxin family protein/rhodanese-related sulfurtransferase/TusA-related sulfurtransferase
VEVRELETGRTYTETYDKLILSPGAEPVRPKLEGIDRPGIFTIRSIPDTQRIKDFVEEQKPERAVVVGAGFVGLEVAENLRERGVFVTVVELADHVIGPLDFDMAAIVHGHLREKNVELYLKDSVISFSGENRITVNLGSGRRLEADMVVLGIGVRPETKIAKEAGLALGPTGGILVDEQMRTSDENIYAVGDAVEIRDFVNGGPALVPLAGPASKQARIAADNICGRPEEFSGTQGTAIVKVFDLTVALTGNNERPLLKNGAAFEKSFTHSASHAGYYPGAIPMSVKLLFSKADGRIFGAQIVGYEGVDKRIDVLATAIRKGMTVYDLKELELAYAPPYSSAKDPVNIAGYVATNILTEDMKIFHWHDIEGIDPARSVILDVRTRPEYELGTVPGALNITLDELRPRLGEIPKDKDVYVLCEVGLRGYLACRVLMQSGYRSVRNLSGGYRTYIVAARKNQSNEDVYETSLRNNEVPGSGCGEEPCIGNITLRVIACGLQCPGPLLKVYKAVEGLKSGEILEIRATDPGFQTDVRVWCERTGNRLLSLEYKDGAFVAIIQKASAPPVKKSSTGEDDKTLILFSGDLDKAIATFIIANGAAALGRKVTIFFTFWGLNVIRKPEKARLKKDFLSRMFGAMMPRGAGKLSLSRMNMAGAGPRMIRYLMKKKRVDSIESLIEQARSNGVRLVACNMSMDLMGIDISELIDGVEQGGVATFLGAAEESDMSLFI